MRLIDADALLNLPFEKMIHTDYGDTCVPIEEIEMAPTIEAFTKDEYEGAYLRGYVDSAKANARPQGEWIPVSDRLPEQGNQSYLVTLEYKEHGKGITTLWYHGKGIGWDLRVADVVTAWQPLPEPYKGEGAE